MKQHTAEFKQELIKMGKQIDSVITYTLNGETITLHEELYKVTPLFEADLLKSVMKQLEIESSVAIPYQTIINYQLGVKVGDSYEYLDYGNYVVFSNEKQEDTNTYKITCYDKMLYSMKPYEEITGTYPMTIKSYLGLLANKIGLTLKDTNFYNYSLEIQTDLYKDLEYTYRDVLDEIAQATGSIIVINSNDQIEVMYPSNSGDTINEEYFKDVNVNFSQKYGPINSIVLSRAGESDNVYLQDVESVQQNGLCEVKIVDNQIMNWNDRSDYLQGLLNALDGIEYYINDFESLGVLYYDIGDYYNVQIGENTYKCLMLNREINVTSGIEEIIHTDMPQESETDYSKADKTDRRINQAYIIVDKQNQTIESVVSNVSDQNTKIAQITQAVDDIASQISDIADITTYGESSYASVQLDDVNESEPIMLKVHPTTTNISYLYPRNNLYPSNNLFMTTRIIRFTRTYEENGETLTEDIDYILPDDLLFYDANIYDEFYLDYESQTCQVTKRCGYNADGTVYALGTEVVKTYTYPEILLGEGNYTISILGYQYGYIFTRLMAKNIYTTQFYTKAETNSLIEQTANSIDLSVNQKLTNYSTTNEMNSAINVKANQITSQVSETYETKNNANTNYSSLNQRANSIESTVSQKVGNNEIISKINQSAEAVTINANKINLAGKTINMTSDNIAINSTNFNVTKQGKVTVTDSGVDGNLEVKTNNGNYSTKVVSPGLIAEGPNGYVDINADFTFAGGSIFVAPTQSEMTYGSNYTLIQNGSVNALTVTQRSKESVKKNIKLYTDNALNIIKNSEIYKYNFKFENDTEKKHIGFVIADKGGNYKTPEEVISANREGIEQYNMSSILWKAIQEQQEQIELLQKEIGILKEGKNNGEN